MAESDVQTVESADEFLKEWRKSENGTVLVFDEAQSISKRRRAEKLGEQFVTLTPELMQKRINYLRQKVEVEADEQ